MQDRWYAPFTETQVAALTAYQTNGAFHPYTCGVDSRHPPLWASTKGWLCLVCGYTQKWAHVHAPGGEFGTVPDEEKVL